MGDQEDFMVQKELLIKTISLNGKREFGVTPVKKELAPNLFQTVGVILSIEGMRYALPMDLLQEMNRYELKKVSAPIFAPFCLMKTATKIWEEQSDDENHVTYKSILEKHFDFSSGGRHPCPDEKDLQFLCVEGMNECKE